MRFLKALEDQMPDGFRRLSTGGDIDRAQPISFEFNGVRYYGYQGDTLASALIANGVSPFVRYDENEEATVEGEGDVEIQTRRIMESLKRILAEAGGTLDDVVRVVIYLVDLNDYMLVHKVRMEYFGDEPPASTCVEVSRLYDPRQLIEIEATAIIPSDIE